MKFGDYLRHARVQRGWTQPEAAARAGIEQSYLSKLETGKSIPSGEIYDRLAGAYGIAPHAMLDILFPAELERLREIDSLRALMLAQSHRRRAIPRRWLTAGLVALALGGGFVGLSMVDRGRDVATFTYVSDQVFPQDGAEGDEPVRAAAATRYIAQMRGPEFTEATPEGVRLWRLVGSGAQWQPARFGWALVPGLLLISAGLGCFFLAGRWR
ncbi:helix-turn-helix domain-containing protein [Coralloluteibacterium stylophorae]|uniref:Helix-turn-helix domain-containing protein n=1 Tax=Coralloluteibacterium stylophorae TaxID=1776034 RepID=A0A8J7VQX5_9GAMM|nr:helix-turn-helix domain-containing protein [Coralloluteibacterium stylophorae]MBS7457160.1 helix-turn-helix domain-containing protein [Coralloluteibacterium stylophorae]